MLLHALRVGGRLRKRHLPTILCLPTGAVCAVDGQAITLLRKRLENELPPVLSGLDAVGIRKELSRAIDEFSAMLHEGSSGD